MTKRALIVLSGGQDSTTCLYAALAAGLEVYAITFDYGQRHSRELEAARWVFADARAAHPKQVFTQLERKVGPILDSTSPLVSDNELEQYKDHQSLPGGIEKTFVPLRNMLFLTLAANYAVSIDAEFIYTGVCQEDYGGYPDCREVFVSAVERAINLSNEGAARPIRIVTPLMDMTKAESVQYAVRLAQNGFNAYGALAYSHTAYDGQYPPVGHDHASLLRAKGFEQANVPDPLVIRACLANLMELPQTPNYHADVRKQYEKFWI